jgi:hypothetical protein
MYELLERRTLVLDIQITVHTDDMLHTLLTNASMQRVAIDENVTPCRSFSVVTLGVILSRSHRSLLVSAPRKRCCRDLVRIITG